ncbi:hypothetical protein CC2G_010667 [Coprinopsis cinerea AmutBmut pab1-1]|nr:hypothetical protein CC2G_010667 [Coprinopsis cinerea AmutBmut pab1-1]
MSSGTSTVQVVPQIQQRATIQKPAFGPPPVTTQPQSDNSQHPGANDPTRSKVIEILSNTANGCLAELGYDPREIQKLRDQNRQWQDENVKLYEDNSRLTRALAEMREQLRQVSNPSADTVRALQTQVRTLVSEKDFLSQKMSAMEQQQPGQVTYTRLYEEYDKLLKGYQALHAQYKDLQLRFSTVQLHLQSCPLYKQQSRAAQAQVWRATASSNPGSHPSTPVQSSVNVVSGINQSHRLLQQLPGHQQNAPPQAGPSSSRPTSSGQFAPQTQHVRSNSLSGSKVWQNAVVTGSNPLQSAPSPMPIPSPTTTMNLTYVQPQTASIAAPQAYNGSMIPGFRPGPWPPAPPSRPSSSHSALTPKSAPPAQTTFQPIVPQSIDTPAASTGATFTTGFWSPFAPQIQQAPKSNQTPPMLDQPSSPDPTIPTENNQAPAVTPVVSPPGAANTSGTNNTATVTQPQSIDGETSSTTIENVDSAKRPLSEVVSEDEKASEDVKKPRLSVESTLNAGYVTESTPTPAPQGSQPVQASQTEPLQSVPPVAASTPIQPLIADDQPKGETRSDAQQQDGAGDDDEEEVLVGPDGLRLVSDCLSDLFEDVSGGRICILCRARYTSGAIPHPPQAFVNASEDDLVRHCLAEHEDTWNELREVD